MPVINYHYIAFKFDRELKNPLFEDEYSALKRNGKGYIKEIIKIKTGHLRPLKQIQESYFSKKRTIIYFSSLIIVSAYSAFMLDIKDDWNSYLSVIPGFLGIWLFIYTIQLGLSTFKTFDSLDDYKIEMNEYFQHHFKLVERTKTFPEYSLLVSNTNLILMQKKRSF